MQQFIFKAALEDLVYEHELANSKVHYNVEPSMKYLTSCYMNVISRIFIHMLISLQRFVTPLPELFNSLNPV